jgi:hypothetical protein
LTLQDVVRVLVRLSAWSPADTVVCRVT